MFWQVPEFKNHEWPNNKAVNGIEIFFYTASLQLVLKHQTERTKKCFTVVEMQQPP